MGLFTYHNYPGGVTKRAWDAVIEPQAQPKPKREKVIPFKRSK